MPPALSIVEPAEPTQAQIKRWLKRITRAEAKWEPDFQRMRENMRFTTGIQWEGQKDITSEDRYIANLTLQMVRRKVADLYARNPEIEVERRERMDFVLWDGSIEQLTMAFENAAMGDMEAQAIIADFMHGREMQDMVDRICKTLQLTFGYQIDCCKPEFKEMLKQLVTRTVICCVGYCRIYCVRGGESPISTTETRHSVEDRARVVNVLMNKLDDGDVDENSPEVEQLKSLALSMGFSLETGDDYEFTERLEFDFPPSTSIIPDERCRSLKEFVGARYVAQRFELPLDEINEVFGLSINKSEIEGYDVNEQQDLGELLKDEEEQGCTVFYEVLDYVTKTSFFIMRGYNNYLREPAPLDPCVAGFWPIFALTFNDIESDNPLTSIFPPSDVDLCKNAQREWNRRRQADRDQRNANAPRYPIRKGQMTENDKQALSDSEPNAVLEFEGIPSGEKPSDWIQPMKPAPYQRELYDTQSLEQDLQLSAGAQQANLGPAQPDVTATVGTIAEQSRMTVSSSNVDDLDGFLSRLARAGVEMILRAFSEETIKLQAGDGALIPLMDREAYIRMVTINVKAASSGRPNKALDTANYERIVPQLIAAGANPIAIIEEGVRRLDDQLDVTKFFPVVPPTSPMGATEEAQPGGGPGASQPLQATAPAASPIPLPAA